MDLVRNWINNPGAIPQRLQFADNFARIRALVVNNTSAATLGLYVDREPVGPPDLTFARQSLTTLPIASALYVTIANNTPTIQDGASVYLYVLDAPLPGSAALQAGTPGLPLSNGFGGPNPTSVFGQNVNAQMEAVDDTTGLTVAVRAFNNGGTKSGFLAVVPAYQDGNGGFLRSVNLGAFPGWGNMLSAAACMLANFPSGTGSNSASLLGADLSIETNAWNGPFVAQTAPLHTTRGGNKVVNYPTNNVGPAATSLRNAAGGTIPAGQMYLAFTWTSSPGGVGESKLGPSTGIVVDAGGGIGVNGIVGLPAQGTPSPYSGINYYLSSDNINFHKQTIVDANPQSPPNIGAYNNAGAAPPATDTTFTAGLVSYGHPLRLCKVQIVTSGAAAVDIWDNASAASGTRIAHIEANAPEGKIYDLDMWCANGYTIVGAAGNPAIILSIFA